MRKRSCAFLIFMFGISLGGCVSFSNYQTAQVQGEGQGQFVGAMTVTTIKAKSAEGEHIYEQSVTYPAGEMMFRVAPFKRIDLGVKTFGPFGGFLVDAKYQFLDTDSFDMAADLGVSYFRVESTDTDPVTGQETTQTNEFLDLYPAILLTYNVSDAFSITLAPKLIRRKITQENSPTETEDITGATVTLALGKRVKVYPEYGVYRSRKDNVDFAHYGVGIGVSF